MVKVDEIDMMILSELSADASISVPKLSKKIHLKTSVTYARIKNMVKKSVIERFTVLVDDRKLGYEVKSLIGLNMNSKMRENVITALLGIGGVRKISEVTGRFDVLVTVYARTLTEMHEVVSNQIGKIEGVLSSESFLEMSVHEKPTPYKIPPGA